MENTKAIITKAYPEIDKNVKSNLNSYKRYISKFLNSRASLIYTNLPCEQLYFSQDDINDFFKSIGVDRNKILEAVKETYYYPIANFNPRYAKDECTVALLCLVRYFKLHNMKKELELALLNIALSGKYYPSIWYRSFQVAAPKEHIMNYVVSNMSNKYDLVREGTIAGALSSICNTWISTYDDRFKKFTDEDVQYLIQQLHNRIGSFMNNIAELYYEANENKLYMTYDSDDVSENDFHLADSDSLKLERAVSATMNAINKYGVDYKICKMASNNNVKTDELRSILENLINNKNNIELIKEYVTLLIVLYFQNNKSRDVTDLEFVSYSIKTKPNSKDKYVLRQREVLDQILINNSEHFERRKNRDATRQAYYRAINAYFAILIQESVK